MVVICLLKASEYDELLRLLVLVEDYLLKSYRASGCDHANDILKVISSINTGKTRALRQIHAVH